MSAGRFSWTYVSVVPQRAQKVRRTGGDEAYSAGSLPWNWKLARSKVAQGTPFEPAARVQLRQWQISRWRGEPLARQRVRPHRHPPAYTSLIAPSSSSLAAIVLDTRRDGIRY
jgi:hypothetical protein